MFNKSSDKNDGLFENQIAIEWLSTDQAAKFLSLSPNALRILVHRNKVKAYKFGHRLRFRLDDLRHLLTRRGEFNEK